MVCCCKLALFFRQGEGNPFPLPKTRVPTALGTTPTTRDFIMQDITNELVERFRRYVAVSSQSNAANPVTPSSEGQLALGRLLQDELIALGLVDTHIDPHGNLTAKLPGNKPGVPSIGFVAHLDTVDVNLSPDIHPQVLHFDGTDLCLNREQDLWIRVAEHPELPQYKGQDILCTDGTSVLGADNKAAVAVIMTMLNQIQVEKRPHGDLHVAFVPDEEIGLRGSKCVDLSRFRPDFAFTIDSCGVGEVVYETFNAGKTLIRVAGVTAHPMSAKGIMVNPVLIAADIVNAFDSKDTPEHTEGKEGYFYFTSVDANPATATLHLNTRDFDKAAYEARKKTIDQRLEAVKQRHPRARIEWTTEDVYGNISDAFGNDRRSIDLILNGMKALGITPNVISMRGGTDGSALSPRGIPTPNYFTGAHNFHASSEFLPLPSFRKSYDLTMKILELAAQ